MSIARIIQRSSPMAVVADTPIQHTRARTAMRSNVRHMARAKGAIRDISSTEAARRHASESRHGRRGPRMSDIV
eukprot:6055145-Heterocapsa_arctica.AAC.1